MGVCMRFPEAKQWEKPTVAVRPGPRWATQWLIRAPHLIEGPWATLVVQPDQDLDHGWATILDLWGCWRSELPVTEQGSVAGNEKEE